MARAHIGGKFTGTGLRPREETKNSERLSYFKDRFQHLTAEQKEELNSNARAYYQANCEYIKAHVNEYRLNNLDVIKKKKAAHYKNTDEKGKRKENRAVAKQQGLFKCDLCNRTYGAKFLKDRHDREQHAPDAAALREARNAKIQERLEMIVTYNGVEMSRRDMKNLKRRKKRVAAKRSYQHFLYVK